MKRGLRMLKICFWGLLESSKTNLILMQQCNSVLDEMQLILKLVDNGLKGGLRKLYICCLFRVFFIRTEIGAVNINVNGSWLQVVCELVLKLLLQERLKRAIMKQNVQLQR